MGIVHYMKVIGGGELEEGRKALSISWPSSRSLLSDPAPVSFYPGMSAQMSNSCRQKLIGSVWVFLGPIPVARELEYCDWPLDSAVPGSRYCGW